MRRRRSITKTMQMTWDGKYDATRWVRWDADEVGATAKMTTKLTTVS